MSELTIEQFAHNAAEYAEALRKECLILNARVEAAERQLELLRAALQRIVNDAWQIERAEEIAAAALARHRSPEEKP